jgi:hypothetical protein
MSEIRVLGRRDLQEKCSRLNWVNIEDRTLHKYWVCFGALFLTNTIQMGQNASNTKGTFTNHVNSNESKRIQCTKVEDKCCTYCATAPILISIKLRALGPLDSHNFECVTNDTIALQGIIVTFAGTLRTTIA